MKENAIQKKSCCTSTSGARSSLQEWRRSPESRHSVNILQDKEEKEHEKMWKDRKGCISQLEHEQMEISLRIQGILSRTEDEVEPAVISNPNERKKNPSSS